MTKGRLNRIMWNAIRRSYLFIWYYRSVADESMRELCLLSRLWKVIYYGSMHRPSLHSCQLTFWPVVTKTGSSAINFSRLLFFSVTIAATSQQTTIDDFLRLETEGRCSRSRPTCATLVVFVEWRRPPRAPRSPTVTPRLPSSGRCDDIRRTVGQLLYDSHCDERRLIDCIHLASNWLAEGAHAPRARETRTLRHTPSIARSTSSELGKLPASIALIESTAWFKIAVSWPGCCRWRLWR